MSSVAGIVGVSLVTILFAGNVVLRLVWRELVRGQHDETTRDRHRRDFAPMA